MKSIKNNTLGFEFDLSVPTDAAEFDTLAGRVGACVEEATANVVYRGWNADFREAFATALEKETGVKRRLDAAAIAKAAARKDGTKPDIKESVGSYVAFVFASTGKTKDDFKTLAETVAAAIPFDPKPSARASKPGKELIAAAESLIAAGPDKLAQAIAKLNELNSLSLELDGDGSISVDELARAVGVNQARKLAEANAELIG